MEFPFFEMSGFKACAAKNITNPTPVSYEYNPFEPQSPLVIYYEK